MQTKTRRRLLFLAGFAVYFCALWLLWPTVWIYPLKIFVVFLHELSHALAGIATGGTVQRITLDPRQGGATYVNGGNAFIMLSAGYLGSLLWGLALLLVARTRPTLARRVVFALGLLLLGATVLFVRNGFGFLFGLLFGFALLASARKLPNGGIIVLLTALGLTSALYALFDIRDDILARPGLKSDAHMLMEMTGIHTLVWGFLWAGIALAACFLVGRKIYKEGVLMLFLVRLLISAAAVWVATRLVPGITYSGSLPGLLGVALVFGIVNAIIRPILFFLTCPLVLLTLGLFVLVLNALMLLLTSALASSLGLNFHVAGFIPALIGGIVIGIVSAILNAFVGEKKERPEEDR